MRLRQGGFTPKIGGRPVDEVTAVPVPEKLILDLVHGGTRYQPLVQDEQKVVFGEPIAAAATSAGNFILPAPASGKIVLDGTPTRLEIEHPGNGTAPSALAPLHYERASAESIKEALVRGGVWPVFRSSRSGGPPALENESPPRAIAINFILTEPFRARGKVIITRSWKRIVTGIRFLQRLISDYGTIEVILTDKNHPVARMMYADLKGYALLRFHSVPLTYPIENPRILDDSLRAQMRNVESTEDIWTIDAQGIDAVGACLGEGLPLHERVVATGGPGQTDPRHYAVRIGTPLDSFIHVDSEKTLVLRGGLLTGVPVSDGLSSVGYDDDAFFFLPRGGKSEFLGFVRPGFTRTSYTRTFAGSLFGGYDRHISATLRGEERPCIACGMCENVCPVGIMPQIIHRYLYRGRTEEAEKAGLERCVGCNLCTYICPSKIDLHRQFSEAKDLLRREREEMLAVASKSSGSENGGSDAPHESGEEAIR